MGKSFILLIPIRNNYFGKHYMIYFRVGSTNHEPRTANRANPPHYAAKRVFKQNISREKKGLKITKKRKSIPFLTKMKNVGLFSEESEEKPPNAIHLNGIPWIWHKLLIICIVANRAAVLNAFPSANRCSWTNKKRYKMTSIILHALCVCACALIDLKRVEIEWHNHRTKCVRVCVCVYHVMVQTSLQNNNWHRQNLLTQINATHFFRNIFIDKCNA